MTSARYLSALLVALVATLALLSSQVVNAQMSEEAKADARPVMERIVERANGSLSQARQETAKLTKRDTYFPSVT